MNLRSLGLIIISINLSVLIFNKLLVVNLAQDTYGLFLSCLSIVIFISTFCSLGIEQGILKFNISDYAFKNRLKNFSWAVVLRLSTTIIFAFFALYTPIFNSTSLAEINPFLLIIGCLSLTIYNVVINALVVSRGNFTHSKLLELCRHLLRILFVIVLIYATQFLYHKSLTNVQLLLISIVMSDILTALIPLAILKRAKVSKENEMTKKKTIKFSRFAKFSLTQWLISLFSLVGSIVVLKPLIALFSTSTQQSIFQISTYLGALLISFSPAILLRSFYLSRISRSREKESEIYSFKHVFSISMVYSFFSCAVLYFWGSILVKFIASSEYVYHVDLNIYSIIVWCMASILLSPFTILNFKSNNYIANILSSFSYLSVIPLSLMLIPSRGASGAIMILAIVQLSALCVYMLRFRSLIFCDLKFIKRPLIISLLTLLLASLIKFFANMIFLPFIEPDYFQALFLIFYCLVFVFLSKISNLFNHPIYK